MVRGLCFSVVLLFISSAGIAQASTIYVPDDYGTIQEAIDASVDFDTIIVRAGTWVERIDFTGKKITLQSEAGAAATVIDGSSLGSVATFQNGEGADSILDGFSITNGLAARGGGLLCDGTTPTIRNCTITGNRTHDGAYPGGDGGNGAGIYSSPTVTLTLDNCTVIDNRTGKGGDNYVGGDGGRGGAGAGIYCGTLVMTGCTVEQNQTGEGGGIDTFGATCGSGGNGGGIHCTTATITSSTIRLNETGPGGEDYYGDNNGGHGGWGAGIFCAPPGQLDITASEISSNTTGSGSGSAWGGGTGGDGGHGGGLHCVGTTLIDCTVTGNSTGDGGDTWTQAGHGGNGGGIHCSTATIEGCTITDNTTGWGGSAPGSTPGPRAFRGRSAIAGDGGSGAGIYCENATVQSTRVGNNTTGGGGFSEFDSGRGGDGGGIFCTAWNLGLTDCTVEGNRTGDGGSGYENSGRGGDGAGVCAPLSAPLDIVDSIISNNATGGGGDGDGSYGGTGVGRGGHGGGVSCESLILTSSTLTGNTTGRGGDIELLLRGGDGGNGGAVHAASATLTECTFMGNQTGAGGDCRDSGSSAGDGGLGGAICSNMAFVDRCTVSGNKTGPGGAVAWGGDGAGDGGSGAGLFTDSGTIMHCAFLENSAGDGGACDSAPGGAGHGGGGAGIHCVTATIFNCLVAGNSAGNGGDCNQSAGDAGNGGSGAGIDASYETVSGCTIVYNQGGAGGKAYSAGSDGTNGDGGGSYSDEMTLDNSIVWGNEPDQLDGLNLTVRYSDVQDGLGEPWFDLKTCIFADPLFDTTFPGGAYFLCHIATGHGADSPCIDGGDPNAPLVDGTTRVDGEEDEGLLDMGYHYPPINIYEVPLTFATIQGAIDAAIDRDLILVSPGTYVENLDFSGKAITVRSTRGAALTIIDGGGAGSAVTFATGESPLSILEGFTITNGNGFAAHPPGGGGITCRAASPLIARNLIVSNDAPGGGGIVCSDRATPIIVNNVIRANTCALDGGGGVSCIGSSPVLTNNTIVGNISDGKGGGIRCVESRATVTNCIVRANSPDQIHGPDAVGTYCNVEGGRQGVGNIDADPRFADSAAGDIHLLFASPCLNRGLLTAPHLPSTDFEGDPRVVDGKVEIGADEFDLHLYFWGDALPGATIDLRLVGLPITAPVVGLAGTVLNDPPLSTSYGLLYLEQPFNAQWDMGQIAGNGLLIFPLNVPHDVVPGKEYYFQALAGEQGLPTTRLTNLLTTGIFD